MIFTLSSILCILLSASAQANLLVYYAFNEGAGDTVRDISGNGNNAKMHNMNDSAWVASKEERFGTPLASHWMAILPCLCGSLPHPAEGPAYLL
jgi:hypothetical protein